MVDHTVEDAVADGQATARENAAAEGRVADSHSVEAIVSDAQDLAQLNHQTDLRNNEGLGDSGLDLTNDTSKTAKRRTAKSQLDPEGQDPISSKEVNDSATDADMTTGNKTAVSNEEAARRAERPGEAEEEAPLSTADEGPDHEEVPEKVAHANSNQPASELDEAVATPKKRASKS